MTLPLLDAERAHLALLERWRKSMNLIGPGPAEPHFEDAARAVQWLSAEGRWVDLGSGAGFPGIALAARFPMIHVTLVEPRARRVAFLEQVVSQAGLKNAEVRRCRSEVLDDTSFDGVVSRAYKPPEAYLADAERLLKPGGVALLMLARQEPPSVEGLELFHVERYGLDGRARAAVGYRR